MSKATHTGRLKSAKYIANKFDRSAMGKEFALYLIENENEVRELNQFGNCDTRYFDGDIGVVSSYFTDLKPIKPVIEIPKCPFWFRDIDDDLCNIIELNNKKYTGRNLVFDCGFEISDNEVNRLLNDGSWTICEEPKKKMRPWNDEEWKEWFLNDRVLCEEDELNTCEALSIKDRNRKFRILGVWYTKEEVIEYFTDRHGNKFEKVAE